MTIRRAASPLGAHPTGAGGGGRPPGHPHVVAQALDQRRDDRLGERRRQPDEVGRQAGAGEHRHRDHQPPSQAGHHGVFLHHLLVGEDVRTADVVDVVVVSRRLDAGGEGRPIGPGLPSRILVLARGGGLPCRRRYHCSFVAAPSFRNVALVAHVDHGKTTLADAMLGAAGVFSAHEARVDRVMDSNDQERERGITILAKAASIEWKGTRINLVDTPGHADFGGEVERALALVDGILLLVDAAEGPMPQTRYVLSKALALRLPAVLVINKVDRPDARVAQVIDDVYELFFDLDAADHHIGFPIISCIARYGKAIRGVGVPGEGDGLSPLLDAIVETIPAAAGNPEAPLQALVTNLDASDYLGRPS